jgi:hypothetical protein
MNVPISTAILRLLENHLDRVNTGACLSCASHRAVRIHARHNQFAGMTIDHLGFSSHNEGMPTIGIVSYPSWLGGNHLGLTICLDCGTVQNFVVRSDDELIKALNDGLED